MLVTMATGLGSGDSTLIQRVPSNSFRGPLRYEIETASTQIEAGSPFSIFVRINNPYDIPVKIQSVAAILPSEFMNPDLPRRSWVTRLNDWSNQVAAPKAFVATALAVLDDEGKPLEARAGPLLLQPGNTALKKFTAKTRAVTLFSPALYTFHIEIQYEIDGKQNRDAVKQQFNIRAPLNALITGSACGGLVGASMHGLKDHISNLPVLWTGSGKLFSAAAAVVGVLVGAVVVVAFARKKDAQPFITIEDFYGGCFVGIVSGYVGLPFLDKILPK
jgi:hypothetical protein